jgi:phosphate acetyltransferase
VNFFDGIKQRVRSAQRRILLSETHDERVVRAAAQMQKEGFCQTIVLGDPSKLTDQLRAAGGDPAGIEIIDTTDKARLDDFIQEYYEVRKAKGATLDDARKMMADPLFYGAMCVRKGLVDGMTTGSASPTPSVIRASLQCVGTRKGLRTLSSCFVIVLPFADFGLGGILIFSDSGVVPFPTDDQLVDIALSAAQSWRQFTATEPIVAMLSFSTKGSAKCEATERIAGLARRVKEVEPTLQIDGELQLDAAIVPDVAKFKAPKSPVAGRANVLIFPDLEAGNIGYKLAERLGRAQAVGPIFQGLAKPINDLSRGCQVQDIVDAAAITAAQTFTT